MNYMLEMLALLQISIFLHLYIEMYDGYVTLGIISQKILAKASVLQRNDPSFL